MFKIGDRVKVADWFYNQIGPEPHPESIAARLKGVEGTVVLKTQQTYMDGIIDTYTVEWEGGGSNYCRGDQLEFAPQQRLRLEGGCLTHA
jgi:hypothetical protein